MDSSAEKGLEGQERLRGISKGLQESSHLQKSRLSNFAFEPVSLPVSRVGHEFLPFEHVNLAGMMLADREYRSLQMSQQRVRLC